MLYEVILPHFCRDGALDQRVAQTDSHGDYETLQRSGTCYYRCVLTVLRYLLKCDGIAKAQRKQLLYVVRLAYLHHVEEDIDSFGSWASKDQEKKTQKKKPKQLNLFLSSDKKMVELACNQTVLAGTKLAQRKPKSGPAKEEEKETKQAASGASKASTAPTATDPPSGPSQQPEPARLPVLEELVEGKGAKEEKDKGAANAALQRLTDRVDRIERKASTLYKQVMSTEGRSLASMVLPQGLSAAGPYSPLQHFSLIAQEGDTAPFAGDATEGLSVPAWPSRLLLFNHISFQVLSLPSTHIYTLTHWHTHIFT